jgi:hypothetical protein
MVFYIRWTVYWNRKTSVYIPSCAVLSSTVYNLLYAFFWVIPRRLKFICRRFGTLFHLHRQVGVCRITQKKAYNIYNTAKVWNQGYVTSVLERVLFDNSGLNQSTLGTGRHEFPQIYKTHWFLRFKCERSPSDGLSECGGAFFNSNKIIPSY